MWRATKLRGYKDRCVGRRPGRESVLRVARVGQPRRAACRTASQSELVRPKAPANDVRIDCKAAKHSDGARGAVLAHLEEELREPRRPPSADCSSGPLGPRANKRRFVNLLQQLARGSYSRSFCIRRDKSRALCTKAIMLMRVAETR